MPRTDDKSRIGTRRRGKLLVLGAATIACLYFCLQFATPFLPALVWSVTIAVLTHPLIMRLGRNIDHEGRRALAGVFIVGTLLYAPVLSVGFVVLRDLTSSAVQLGQSQRLETWLHDLEAHPQLGPVYRRVAENFHLENDLREAVDAVRKIAMSLLSGSFYVVAQSLLTLWMIFFLYRDGRRALATLRRWLPLSDAETSEYFRRVDDTLHAVVLGTFVCAVLQGSLAGLIFWMLGLPAPVLWGVVVAMLAVVPMGTFVIWVPTTAGLAVSGEWGKALILAGWAAIAISVIDNFIYPALVGKRLHQHTLISLVAVVGGVAVFGVMGLVLGPLVMTTTIFLLDLWRKRTSRGTAAEDGA